MAKDSLTPMMRQFFDLKQKHPDAILLFRCGDFYETYMEDAVLASQILGITLTRRNNTTGAGDTQMAGFPFHALDTYLPKLVRAGKRVAICDQLEDPKLTKKLVKRGITELVTPGVAMTDNMLSARENNFLCAIHFGAAACGMALMDISTGEFLVTQGSADQIDKLLASFSPKEILYERSRKGRFETAFGARHITYPMDEWAFNYSTARERLLRQFGVKTLKGFGVEHLTDAITAAGAILHYLEQTQHTNLSHVTGLKCISEDSYVRMDKFTIRNLELLLPLADDGVSLLSVIDRTVTPMGSRMLRRWMMFPLCDIQQIGSRQDVVEYFFRDPDFTTLLTDQLHRIGDMERIAAKVSVGRVGPRDMHCLRTALEAIVPIKMSLEAANVESLQRMGGRLEACLELAGRIRRTLKSDLPLTVAKGGVIAEGVSEELDELRSIATGGKDKLLEIQQREVQRTGITSMKVGYNNVFGYYLEVRNTFRDNVPSDWIRKQTLVNAERYITQELKEYEEKILGAEEKILTLEIQLFNELVAEAALYTQQLQTNATVIATIDCLRGFAEASYENHYIRPIVDQTMEIDIRQGRHPVIERTLPAGEKYVANDVFLDDRTQQIMIITGPNMAGKSALLRQTALITLMAQIGCFVPADSARIGMVDRIFTRVGASDNISVGESTFMVEMTEAAAIMNNLSPRSLVLFDELGRGTSTYDGISIAWAIVEHIHENPSAHARTLFATHYHELNDMEERYQRVKNYNVSVREADGRILFVRKLERGGSEHSFGIHVARLAGLPANIVKRADEVMHALEQAAPGNVAVGQAMNTNQKDSSGVQLNMFQLDDPVLEQIRDTILGLDIDNLTPIEALTRLNNIKRILKT